MKKPIPVSRKTLSYRMYRRQFVWQIFVPIIIAVLLAVAASIFAATRTGGTASLWADISLIWLLIPILVATFLFFILLVGLIYTLALLLKITPNYTYQTRQLVYRAQQMIERAADSAAKPVLFLEGISASIKRLFRDK
ncbi:MAG: hypothetical protein L3J16_03675 [Anaerolineales bacterium]|nr:hypothetical protein [Anaerolineales bacterium]